MDLVFALALLAAALTAFAQSYTTVDVYEDCTDTIQGTDTVTSIIVETTCPLCTGMSQTQIGTVYPYNRIHNRVGDPLFNWDVASDIYNYRVLHWSNSDIFLGTKLCPSGLHYHRDCLHCMRRAAMDRDNDCPM